MQNTSEIVGNTLVYTINNYPESSGITEKNGDLILPLNSEFVVSIDSGRIKIKTRERSNEQILIRFMSVANPIYGSVDYIIARLSQRLREVISEYDIYKMIAGISQKVDAMFGGSLPQNLVPIAVDYVMCYLLSSLFTDAISEIAGIKEREQFGLRIEYDTGIFRHGGGGPYDSCADDALQMLFDRTITKVSSGVKSRSTGTYPDRRKDIINIPEGYLFKTVP